MTPCPLPTVAASPPVETTGGELRRKMGRPRSRYEAPSSSVELIRLPGPMTLRSSWSHGVANRQAASMRTSDGRALASWAAGSRSWARPMPGASFPTICPSGLTVDRLGAPETHPVVAENAFTPRPWRSDDGVRRVSASRRRGPSIAARHRVASAHRLRATCGAVRVVVRNVLAEDPPQVVFVATFAVHAFTRRGGNRGGVRRARGRPRCDRAPAADEGQAAAGRSPGAGPLGCRSARIRRRDLAGASRPG
jgi:hypothetical protein